MDTDTRVEELTGFLRNLYGDRKVSLARATITDRGKTTQTFHEGAGRLKPWSSGIEGLAHSMIKKSDRGTEIFYAPTPMSGDKGRKKEQALPNVVVFGDADEGLTADAKSKLIELGACLVRSGGIVPATKQPKYHVYLLLTEEVPPEELERLNRGLKVFIRGDKFDSTTLLRLPGTRNHKYPNAPIVRVERFADARHTPTNLIKFLGVDRLPADTVGTPSQLTMPTVPKDFNPKAFKYARMRKVVREWNGRFQTGSCRRYMATIAIVKDAIKYGFDIDEAYAFATLCEPLQDKQEEENGYRIDKDVARTWQREAGMKPSGTLTADDIVSTPQTPEAREKTTTTPPVSTTPPTFSGGPVRIEFGPGFPFARPNLDELLSGDYKPLEPTLVSCGEYFLLYPGKSHGLSSDRGMGKTHVTIAMIHDIMKRGGRVAYFDFEDSADTFIRDRMMSQHGVTEDMIRNQFLYLGGVAGMEMDMISLTSAIEMLAEQLKGWDLVVIDGVSASMADWSVEDDEHKPSQSLDGSKATDYAWWHNKQVKPFLDQGIATLQIDHSTKQGGRVGGTIQKGAKLTGVEYELRPDKIASTLVMGATGRLILSAVKDRVGRIIRYKRKHAADREDDWWNDVAVFVMTSSMDGKITRATFEPVNDENPITHTHEADQPLTLTETQQRVMDVLVEAGKPMNKSRVLAVLKMNRTVFGEEVQGLIGHGLIEVTKEGSSHMLHLIANAPAFSPHTPGEKDLDFSKADRMPRGAKVDRECRKCGDFHTYPDDFAQPDDVGFQVGRPMCKPCAAENIESESYMPRDGAEWARQVRKRKERGDS